MAEGWARHFHNDWLETSSAGIEKHGLNKNAVQVMNEAGVDISSFNSKILAELPDLKFDLVITVCGNANERCPIFPGKTKVVHIPFDDPPEMAKKFEDPQKQLDCYRKVRDEIKSFVKTNLKKYFESSN